MSKTFWAIIAAIILIFGGIIFLNKKEANAPTSNAQPTSHIRGAATSAVTLVEYGDFECPACGQYYPIVEQVFEKYKDKIKFQFRNLPLIQAHQNALAAHRAAEAASNQNKFWEMYNLLYQNQVSWSTSSNATAMFEQYATQLGLSVQRFKTEAASAKTNDIINADIVEFKKTKQTMSTPTFFLNGELIKPKATVESFSQLIDEALAAKKS